MTNRAYETYWHRKRLLSGPVPQFPLRRWWQATDLCEIERIYFDAIQGAGRLLDVGAGDLRIMKKLQAAGFAGRYDTQDIGKEFAYTFATLAEATGPYEAILCFDVIEHLPLESGLGLIADMAGLLGPGGVLIVQTPNARCIRSPLSWDMTHMQLYSLTDLWAFTRTLGMETEGYRIAFQSHPRIPLLRRWNRLIGRYITTRLLGSDFADNIALIAKKQG